MPFIKFNSQAFTLIELLVSIGIIALISAVAIPNLRNFNKTQEIDNAASQLVNVLRTAQSSAASRIKCPNNEASFSWQVNLTTAGAADTYSLISNCTTLGAQTVINNSPFAAAPNDQTTFSASTNICPAPQNTTLYFRSLQVFYQCTNGAITSVDSDVRITLTNQGSTLSKVIVVQPGGIIRIE